MLDGLLLAEAVTFTRIEVVDVGHTTAAQGFDQLIGLGARYYDIIFALEDSDGILDPVYEEDRGALLVEFSGLREGTDHAVQVMGFELVGVRCECKLVGDPKEVDPSAELVIWES